MLVRLVLPRHKVRKLRALQHAVAPLVRSC